MFTGTGKIVAAALALAAAIGLGTTVLARDGGHGGGGRSSAAHFSGHSGGGHFSGFSGAHVRGFSGAHFSGTHVRGFSGTRFSGAHVRGFSGAHASGSHYRSAHIGRSFGPARIQGSRGHYVNGTHVHGLRAASVLGDPTFRNHSWNHWGNSRWQTGWHGGWGGGWSGWGGSVFWPYFYGDLLAFVFWPYGYYYPYWFDPFWAYGNIFIWDAIFWPGPSYGPYYAYAPEYDDVYGDRYSNRARRYAAREASGEITGSISNNVDFTQTCNGLAPGITDLPIDQIEKSLHLTDEQRKALDALKTASSQASEALRASCSSTIALTPVGRLDTVQKRLDGMIQALGIIRPPLDNFYNSLNDEQRQRFAELGPSTSRSRRRSTSANDLTALCLRRSESFTQLPVERIEQVVKPTQQQQDALDRLRVASSQAANQVQAFCPTEMPKGLIGRFDAISKRLDAMSAAIKTVRPALDSFYSSLTDEQKARFNILGPPKTTGAGRS
jgi:hypothetical protein